MEKTLKKLRGALVVGVATLLFAGQAPETMRRLSENERCTTRRTVKKTVVVRNEPEVESGFISDGGEKFSAESVLSIESIENS